MRNNERKEVGVSQETENQLSIVLCHRPAKADAIYFPLTKHALTSDKTYLECLVFYAALTKFAVLSRRFLDKLPLLLLHVSIHKRVSRNANPATLSAKEGSHYFHCERLHDI